MRRLISMAGSNLIPAFQLSLRAAVAAGLALVAAQLLRLEHPLYAMISAVIVTDLVPSQTPKLALPRLAGTLVGSAIGVRHHHPAAIRCLQLPLAFSQPCSQVIFFICRPPRRWPDMFAGSCCLITVTR